MRPWFVDLFCLLKKKKQNKICIQYSRFEVVHQPNIFEIMKLIFSFVNICKIIHLIFLFVLRIASVGVNDQPKADHTRYDIPDRLSYSSNVQLNPTGISWRVWPA